MLLCKFSLPILFLFFSVLIIFSFSSFLVFFSFLFFFPFLFFSSALLSFCFDNAKQAGILGNYYTDVCSPDSSDLSCISTLLQEMTRFNSGGNTTFAQGCEIIGGTDAGIAAAVAAVQAADAVVLALGIDQAKQKKKQKKKRKRKRKVKEKKRKRKGKVKDKGKTG